MAAIQNRYDFVLLFDVRDGNPNGDPDAGNNPRTDPETGHGLVSDVCLKRKIRNYVCLAKTDPAKGQPAPGYDIYVKEKAILTNQHQRAYDALGLKSDAKGEDNVVRTRAWMCQTFFDIRMFGAVMSLKAFNCGQVRGPVQFAFARSVDRVATPDLSITRMAVATTKEAEEQAKKQEGGNRTMGRKSIVPYGLYRAHGFISPHLAADTGFNQEDLDLLWQSLAMMFDHDRSAARGEMATQKLVVFKHDSALGNAPAHKLFERVKISLKDPAKPARAYSDYTVTVDGAHLPAGITIEERV